MLRVLLVATLARVAAARLLQKSKTTMRAATRIMPLQIPVQVPVLVPMGSNMDQAGPFFQSMPSMPSMPFMLNAGPGPELDDFGMDMQMDSPFGNGMIGRGFMAGPTFQTQQLGQLEDAENAQNEAIAQSSSSTSVSRQQQIETLKNGTKQLRTVETRCQNGKCQKKETVRLIKPSKLAKAAEAQAKAAQNEQKTVPAANVGPSPKDAAFAAGPPSIEDVLHQVMGFGREMGELESGVVPRFPFGAEGVKIKMPQGPGAPAAPLSLKHLDNQDEIQGTLPTGMNGSDLKVDQSGHVVTVQYRMKNGPSTVGVEQRFSLDFTPAEKPKAKYSKASGKFSLEIPRPKNAQSSSSDVEIVMDDEEEPGKATTPPQKAMQATTPSKKATHSAKSHHQKHDQKQEEELKTAKQHLEAALDPKAEPIIMLEFSS